MGADIFARELAGEGISPSDPEYYKIAAIQKKNPAAVV